MGCASSSEAESTPALSTIPAASQSKRSSFRPIPDRYETLEKSFGGRCLHEIDSSGVFMNPYQSVISVIGRVLKAFDDDNIIPAFGFGDLATKGNSCFPFTQGRGCQGFEEVLRRYNEITPTLKLSGPTNFAPVIKETIRAVQQNGGYHILVIIADGQVTNEEDTRNAIVEASNWPIFGDGPWDMMEEFDDKLPARRFDNFQFVEYNSVMQVNKKNPEAGFAIMAMMEIPGTFWLCKSWLCVR
ncbi:Copine [Phytophthora cactorum]|nr:Copine [Phytophthora cactorum]KAF1790561.1 Copine [Phytophthora cactorum]